MPGGRALGGAVLLAAAAAGPARAQQRVVIQGVIDAEGWRTAGGSNLLARNDDRPALLGRMYAWGAADLGRHFLLFAMTEAETGAGSPESEFALEQLTLTWRPSPSVGLSAGRLPAPIGAFVQRRLSPSNPLIGIPDGYAESYPWGLQLSGTRGRFDYRIAAIDRPVSNEKYLPEGGSRLRLAMGGGITPVPSLRVGMSYTAGSYLSDEVASEIEPSKRWSDYGQRILAFDARFTRGYFELRGETAFSSYEVPGQPDAVTGVTSFVEVKQTWTPRLFTALRLEHNGYAFVRPLGGGQWLGRRTTFYDGEIGLGFRLDPKTLIKVSHRRDDWQVEPPLDQFLKNGTAFAIQISRGFDLF